MRRVGVGFAIALAVCASALGATTLPIRPATPADADSRAGDALHTLREWWTVRATDPKTGDYVYVRLIDRPTPVLEASLRSGAIRDGTWDPVFTQVARPRAAVAFQSGGGQLVTLTRSDATMTFDSAFPSAAGHVVLHASAHGVTVGPWRLPSVGVGGPPPTPVPGTLMWSLQVPAGSADGWLELAGKRVSFHGWSAYVDHWWGAFDLNWFHGDFGIAAGATTWVLVGLEPGAGQYRWYPSDARWRGVLVRTTGGRVAVCRARVVRHGWLDMKPLASSYSYWAPTIVRASCGSASHVFHRETPGVDDPDGIVRAGGPTSDGMFQHMTPAFG